MLTKKYIYNFTINFLPIYQHKHFLSIYTNSNVFKLSKLNIYILIWLWRIWKVYEQINRFKKNSFIYFFPTDNSLREMLMEKTKVTCKAASYPLLRGDAWKQRTFGGRVVTSQHAKEDIWEISFGVIIFVFTRRTSQIPRTWRYY